jgi:hypothetical protein
MQRGYDGQAHMFIDTGSRFIMAEVVYSTEIVLGAIRRLI